ncbi:hypothetical protein FS749_001081 [Ceratobasidium sp. UAMH 11750]|nr:hypothetical protein FS749_001081 [Ceratobasidium sp. UAMH 11750]
MDDDDNLPTLADFFFHAGDKTSYSSSLEGLFVCYTLTRGLQLEGTNPRRPALPLELILRITRFAGYMDAKPDPSLTLNVDRPDKVFWFCSPPLSRKHLTSMARIHFVPLQVKKRPKLLPPFSALHSFEPFGECQVISSKYKSPTLLLLGNDWFLWTIRKLGGRVRTPNHFPPDYMVQIFGQGDTPVRVACGAPAQVLFWRWWEPKF